MVWQGHALAGTGMHEYLRRIIDGLLLAPDNGVGNGGGGSSDDEEIDDDNDLDDGEDVTDDTEDTDDSNTDDNKKRDANSDSPSARFERLLGKYHGDTRKVAEVLFRDNYKLRTSRGLLRTENDELRRQVPRKGAMNITPQEYKDFQAYRKLGTPKDVAAGLTRRNELEQEVTRTKKVATISKAARAVGFNATVLQELGSDLEYIVRTDDETGDEEAFVVSTSKENGATVKKEIPLDEYADKHWKIFKRSLLDLDNDADESDDSDGKGRTRNNGRGDSRGDNTFIRQRGGANQQRRSSSNNRQSVGAGYLRSRYAPAKENN